MYFSLSLLLFYQQTHRTPVNQKKDIKRQKDRLEALKKEAEEERARARQAARERVLRDFERGQLGLAGNSTENESATSNAEGCESGCIFKMSTILYGTIFYQSSSRYKTKNASIP